MSIRVLCLAGLLAVAGCGGGAEGRATVYPVTGKITVGGAPLTDANVSFAPRSTGGKTPQPFARGNTDAQGVYHLTTYDYQDGAAAGEFEVLVTKSVSKPGGGEGDVHAAMEAGGEAPSHDGKDGVGEDSAQSLVNEKYTKTGSGLNATVTKEGPNEFDFDLDP